MTCNYLKIVRSMQTEVSLSLAGIEMEAQKCFILQIVSLYIVDWIYETFILSHRTQNQILLTWVLPRAFIFLIIVDEKDLFCCS